MMLDGIKREAEITKKVLAAIPDAKSDYKPDPTPAAVGNWPGTWPTPMSNFSMRLLIEVRHGSHANASR